MKELPEKIWVPTYLFVAVNLGNKVEKLCDLCNITVNKNAVFGDSSALAPGGVRIGMSCSLIRCLNLISRIISLKKLYPTFFQVPRQ